MCDLAESGRQAGPGIMGPGDCQAPLRRDAHEILGLACGQADQLANKWVLIRNPQRHDETCFALGPLRSAREMPFGWDPQP